MKASFQVPRAPSSPSLRTGNGHRLPGQRHARPSHLPQPDRDFFLPGEKPAQVCNWKHEPRYEEKQKEFGLRFSDWLKKKLKRLVGKIKGKIGGGG